VQRIGFSLQANYVATIPDIRKAIRVGFTHIELKWDNFASQDDQIRLIEPLFKIDWHGITLSLHAPSINVNIASPSGIERRKSIERVMVAIRAAMELRAAFVVFHAGKIPGGMPRNKQAKDKAHAAQLQSISTIVAFCEELGIVPALENGYSLVDLGLVTNIDDMARVAESVPGLTFVLDIGHFILNSPLTDIQKQLENCPQLHFSAIHLHDNKRIADTHLPLGEGALHGQKQELTTVLKLVNTCPIIIECTDLATALKSRRTLLSSFLSRQMG